MDRIDLAIETVRQFNRFAGVYVPSATPLSTKEHEVYEKALDVILKELHGPIKSGTVVYKEELR